MLKYLLLSLAAALCLACRQNEAPELGSEFKSDSNSIITVPSEALETVPKKDSLSKLTGTLKDSLDVKPDSGNQSIAPKSVRPSIKPKSQKNVPKSKEVKPVLKLAEEADYFSVAQTLEESRALSRLNFERAKSLLNKNLDSALIHTRFALQIYENGSLFTLCSLILLKKENYSAAVISADRSLIQNDHWDETDLKTAYRVKAEALKELNKKYPSQDTFLKWVRAKNQYEVIK